MSLNNPKTSWTKSSRKFQKLISAVIKRLHCLRNAFAMFAEANPSESNPLISNIRSVVTTTA